MCMKKVVKEAIDYIKPIGAGGVPFLMAQLPVAPSPAIIYVLIDVLKVVGSIAAIIYTVAKTYFLIKNRGNKND